MIFTIGQKIVRGKYVIESLLGKGGFGEVYKAVDSQLERPVAIKVIQRNALGSTADEYLEYEERFKLEARIGAQIRDDNVIGVYGLEQHGRDLLVLVTEFASGGSLASRLAAGPLTPDQVFDLGIQICKGLAAIHRPPLNGVHRDIKPSNILFDDRGRAKIADLGLVQIYGMSGQRSIGMAGMHPGTPGYMSPEQEHETNYLTPASDIYSVGCVLFEALTQRVYQHLPPETKVSSLNPDTPLALEAVIEKALRPDPTERYQDAQEMLNALEKAKAAPQTRGMGVEVTGSPPPTYFQFRSGGRANTPAEWAAVADQNWTDGAYHLSLGHLENWLASRGHTELANQVISTRQAWTDAEIGLENVLYLLAPELPRPELFIEEPHLDGGQLERGDKRTLRLTIQNRSRGLLVGQLEPQVPWLRVSRPQVRCRAGQSQIFEITLDSRELPEGEIYEEQAILVSTNGGQATVSARLLVTWLPALAVTPQSLNFGEYLAGSPHELRQLDISVRNAGGGLLRGAISTDANWLAISPTSFELSSGEDQIVQVTADTSRLEALGIYQNQVIVASEPETRTLGARIAAIKPQYQASQRWKLWGQYLGAMSLSLLGWGWFLSVLLLFLIYGLILSAYYGLIFNLTPEVPYEANSIKFLTLLFVEGWKAAPIWQKVLIVAVPLISWGLALFVPPRLCQPLDEIENFYHQRDLAEELPGRQKNRFKQLLTGAVLALFAMLLSYLTLGALDAGLAVVIVIVYGLAGMFLGLLLNSPLAARGQMPSINRLLAGPRAAFTSFLFILVVFPLFTQNDEFELDPNKFNWFSLLFVLYVVFGMLLAGEHFFRLPLRVRWIYARVMPVLPAFLLMVLFFCCVRMFFLPQSGLNIWTHYAAHTQISRFEYEWVKGLIFILGILGLGVLGLWLDTAGDANFRRNLPAFFASLLISVIPALVVYLVLAFVSEIIGYEALESVVFGIVSAVLVMGTAAATLWFISRRGPLIKDRLWSIFGRISSALGRLTRRAATTVTSQIEAQAPGVTSQVGQWLPGRGTGAGRAHLSGAWQGSQLTPGRKLPRFSLGDYLTGIEPLSSTAIIMALTCLLFAMPPTFGLAAMAYYVAKEIGKTLLLFLLCLVIPLLVGVAGYRYWKRTQSQR